MALTATASPATQQAITELLNLADPAVVSKSLDRPNIYLSASAIKSLTVSNECI